MSDPTILSAGSVAALNAAIVQVEAGAAGTVFVIDLTGDISESASTGACFAQPALNSTSTSTIFLKFSASPLVATR